MPRAVHQHLKAELPRAVAEYVGPLARQAISERGKFTVALSGGSMPKALGADDGLRSLDTDWASWHVFFSDERLVDLTHDDSNYKACKEHFLSKVDIPEEQIYKIDSSLSAEDAAVAYQAHLKTVFGEGMPTFDLVSQHDNDA